MNRRKIVKLLTAAVLGGLPMLLSANGFRLASQDGLATARGEAFVATADNPSAIYYNPAGITQLAGNNLRSGVYGIYLNPSYRPPSGAPNGGNTYHIENNLAAVPQLFYTCTPENLPLSFGLGVYAPYGLGVSWPDGTGFRAVAMNGSLTYLRINPVVALKLTRNLSIGGGVMVDYGNMVLEQGMIADPLPPNFFRFKGDGWGVGYNLGLLWQPVDQISVGAAFRSSTTITLAGQTEAEKLSQLPLTYRSAQADFAFPLTAVLGISYRPTPKWNLEFDADYTDWSSLGTINIRQAPENLVPDHPTLILNWQASWMYEFGVTRYFDNGWHASAGFVYNENSVPKAYYTPLVADLDRYFFSVGAGRNGKRFDFDIAYQFGYGPTHTVTGSTPSTIGGQIAGQTADGKYDFISHAVLVTVGLHF
ncbi:MAG: outer membrane protein transport protein [Verrucomicrobiota bacterium]|jgi:long-chain fatty acid transport protein